jgi:hypothetical protein
MKEKNMTDTDMDTLVDLHKAGQIQILDDLKVGERFQFVQEDGSIDEGIFKVVQRFLSWNPRNGRESAGVSPDDDSSAFGFLSLDTYVKKIEE